jgi:mono/diheme cytochrome c family protein
MASFTGLIQMFLAVVLLPGFGPERAPQTTFRTPPPLVISSMAGGDLFRFYCAPCHGADGRGRGPVAASLRTSPSGLTALSRRYGGSFPRADITLYVTGDEPRPVVAHGSTEMPVWGPIFRALDPDERTRTVRIANILDYVQSMQRQ